VSVADPPRFALADQTPGWLTLTAAGGATAHLFVLEEDIVRVMVLPDGVLTQPRSWAIAPGLTDLPATGRDRFDLSGFSLPAFTFDIEGDVLTLSTARIRLTVQMVGLLCAWAIKVGDQWRAVARDRPTQAYNFGLWDEKVYHYLSRAPDERYYGLGERSGAMDRAGRRFRLSNIDAMGYDARTSDPLYKHFPVYITVAPQEASDAFEDGAPPAFAVLYDTLSDCSFDFGQELDNYHGPYRSFVADHGDLDYYLIAGPQVEQVVRRLTWLTGRPAFPPRWSLGYSGSTMAYTDAPDAQAQMGGFLADCARHDILCDSFHLSSGYTSIGPRRHVFHWNRDKFPDPAGFVQAFADQGVRLCANIKPCLLADNPLFAEAAARGLLIADPDGSPSWVQFWDGPGAYIDFTARGAADWWADKVTNSLLDLGVAATWNDNNEYEVWSDKAQAAGFGQPRPAREFKPLQTQLMLRASRQAQIAKAPDQRPYLVSRAGGLGLQRYVQTWSGDNRTSWETLKYNIKMGLGLALSGVSNLGHDIGGFSGPAPDPELLVRWVQAGLFLPRFSIHSWNDDGSVNAPWMWPEVAPTISNLIKLRARFVPYLYDLTWRHHSAYAPILRPTFLDFPDDPACWAENDEMMIGPDLLVAPVTEPGQTRRAVHLPAGADWWDLTSGRRFRGGRAVTRPAPWDQPVAFARAGCVIPINIAPQGFAEPADARALLLFAPTGEGAFEQMIYEDDGQSWPDDPDAPGGWRVRVEADARAIRVRIEALGGWRAPPPPVLPPAGERRRVVVA